MRAWLRRNRWGLAALPLVLALIGAPEADDLINRYYYARYVSAIEVASGTTGTYGKGRVRLQALEPVEPTDYDGKPVAFAGYRFWRAELAFDLDEAKALDGCAIALEDRSGRRFSAGPHELAQTKLSSGSCFDFDNNQRAFNSEIYFMLPADAQPAAIRIELSTLKPRFLRLQVGG
jgi:hypothetical protein